MTKKAKENTHTKLIGHSDIDTNISESLLLKTFCCCCYGVIRIHIEPYFILYLFMMCV